MIDCTGGPGSPVRGALGGMGRVLRFEDIVKSIQRAIDHAEDVATTIETIETKIA